MNILIVNAYCLQVNSSANLCHIAYIQGLIDLGYHVTVLSSSIDGYIPDESMSLPKGVKTIYIDGISLYEKISHKKQRIIISSESNNSDKNKKITIKKRAIKKIKRSIMSCYGVHEIYNTFVRKAKRLRFSDSFDYVISLSSPAASHLVAYNLIQKNRVSYKHWIQVWEDPWYGDVYGFQNKKSIMKEERRLLKCAEKVCYVSPLTLKDRQELFPESAHKMYWQPLPYYYKNNATESNKTESNQYGYFGDYVPASRNLLPFYKAAYQCRISVNICGDPSNLFPSSDKITTHPRLPLDKLHPIEDATNVLVFLCNRKGGQIPGKIYQYSATYKTILFILDGTDEEKHVLKEYFQKFNRYVFCENTVEDITRAIKDIESGNIENVVNEPIDAFNPKETVRKILAGENG